MPFEGKDYIEETVFRYRDATQYLRNRSIRLINEGYTAVELQHALEDLPDRMRAGSGLLCHREEDDRTDGEVAPSISSARQQIHIVGNHK